MADKAKSKNSSKFETWFGQQAGKPPIRPADFHKIRQRYLSLLGLCMEAEELKRLLDKHDLQPSQNSRTLGLECRTKTSA